jgi:DNA-binding transcriptional MerR regulator
MTIGQLSRRTLISVRALRHYDDIGLLKPASIDPTTGYRSYEEAQVGTAALIRRLRDLDVPLDGVRRAVLDGEASATLLAHRAVLSDRIEADRRALQAIDDWIENGDNPMTFDITTRHIEPEAVATFRWRGQARESLLTDPERWMTLAGAVIDAGGTFAASIGIANAFDLDGVADLELGFVTEALLAPTDKFVSRVLDGGEFASVHFDRWSDKPAAYAALERWLDENGRVPRGPSRERGPLPWPAEPRTVEAIVVDPDPSGWRTEILLPIS